jgi:VWFA-related protein
MKTTTLRKMLGYTLMPAIVSSTIVLAQNPPTTGQQGTVFRSTTNAVRTDVIVRDRESRFVPDLKISDFRVYEDGVLQNITYFAPRIGGRSLGNLATSGSLVGTLPQVEGLRLPAPKPRTDASGRLFIIFIDDLHVLPGDTPRLKDLLKKTRDTLVHENDLVAFVSTGTSSIEIDPSYDYGHRRFNEAINKVMGSAPSVDEIIQGAVTEGREGPQGMRFNVHTAFKTAYSLIDQLSAVTDRRKAFVYISSGYTFNPLKEARLDKLKEQYLQTKPTEDDSSSTEGTGNPDPQETLLNEEYHKRTAFSQSELISELAQITRAAQRANVTFYTIDPKGLRTVSGDASTREQIAYSDLRDLASDQISSLRVLAEETGGFAGVESNDFDGILRRIDSETSDYYEIGYTSSNPDPTKIRRIIKIEIDRAGLQAPIYRSEYTIPRQRK